MVWRSSRLTPSADGAEQEAAEQRRAAPARAARGARSCRCPPWPAARGTTCTLMSPARRISSCASGGREPVAPARAARRHGDDMGDVVGAGELQHALGFAGGGHRGGHAAHAFGQAQRLGDAVAFGFALRHAGFDMHRRPGRAQPVGQPPGIADRRRPRRAVHSPPPAAARPLPRGRRWHGRAYSPPSARPPAGRCGAAPVRAAPPDCRAAK